MSKSSMGPAVAIIAAGMAFYLFANRRIATTTTAATTSQTGNQNYAMWSALGLPSIVNSLIAASTGSSSSSPQTAAEMSSAWTMNPTGYSAVGGDPNFDARDVILLRGSSGATLPSSSGLDDNFDARDQILLRNKRGVGAQSFFGGWLTPSDA